MQFVPSADNPDPSEAIDGVVYVEYPTALHVQPNERVAYTHSPPFGGQHDGVWAKCTGIVYPQAIRTENAVHSLEHGAVWITYNPDLVSAGDVELLAERVSGNSHMLMSPYPTLDAPSRCSRGDINSSSTKHPTSESISSSRRFDSIPRRIPKWERRVRFRR